MTTGALWQRQLFLALWRAELPTLFYLSELSLKFWCLEGCGRLKIFLKACFQNHLENSQIPDFHSSSTEMLEGEPESACLMKSALGFQSARSTRQWKLKVTMMFLLKSQWLLGYICLISCVSLILACGGSSGVISTNIGCQFVKSRESASGN